MITRLWPSLRLADRTALPRAPGVYICRPWFGLWRASYVGQSRNLHKRWCGPTPHHRLGQLPWHTRISYRVLQGATRGELEHVEGILIAKLRPTLNYTPLRRRPLWAPLWLAVLALAGLFVPMPGEWALAPLWWLLACLMGAVALRRWA